MEKTRKIDVNTTIDPLLKDVDKNFEKIIEICKPLIYYSISLVAYHPPITSEDLFQECTIELWRICKKYKRVRISFATYLINDLRNHLINYVQRNQYVLTVPYNELRRKSFKELSYLCNGMGGLGYAEEIDAGINIEQNIYEFEDDRLDYIKAHLCQQEWELLTAIVVNEDSYAEYGRQHGISRVAARKRWLKLKEKLGMS